jgi:hypothetical protein
VAAGVAGALLLAAVATLRLRAVEDVKKEKAHAVA